MFLAFYLDMGLTGIWIAKFIMESFQAICYTYLVDYWADWDAKAAEAANRQKKEISTEK
jgi:Na+-driven multidrug efflux pump